MKYAFSDITSDLQGTLTAALHLAAMHIEDDINECEGEPLEYISSLKLRAAAHWWPALHRLQLAAPLIEGQALDSTVPVSELLSRWAAFGALIGLDAAEERKRYDRGRQERCNWRNCQCRTSVNIESLRKCAGCGEVRYCSKECQKL